MYSARADSRGLAPGVRLQVAFIAVRGSPVFLATRFQKVMRAALTGFFTVLGLFLTYLFMVSAAGRVPTGASLTVQMLAPFQNLDSMSLLCLQGAFVAFLMAMFFKLSTRTWRENPEETWSHLLETAFGVNVLFIGGILIVFLAYGCGWVSVDNLTTGTLGALLGVALLEAALGVVLAVLLAFRTKSRTLYFSALSAHLAELSLLGIILFMGFS